jgi:membrane-bound lytic murein transglycosylase B
MHILRGWAARHTHWLGLAAAFAVVQPTLAADYQESPQVSEFIGEMNREYGFAAEQLGRLFAEVQRKQSILDAISRPAEKVKPWKDYRPIFITDSRIARGVDFWREHEATLARAEAEYGVPAQVIVAIIGVETFYGGNTGSYRVVDALSTLAFDYPPRAPFFRKELREFLMLSREEQVDPLTLKGSYAGAMGLPQFMPSSFRAYARRAGGQRRHGRRRTGRAGPERRPRSAAERRPIAPPRLEQQRCAGRRNAGHCLPPRRCPGR